ncbi:MAG: MSHA biogenesis protein MshE, partial [Burkholderiales bacterium]
ESYQPLPGELEWLAHAQRNADGATFRKGRGCSHCNGTGFAGRIGVYEMLEMTPDLARAVVARDPSAFGEAARPQMKGARLTERALELVRKGRTTVAEVLKVATQVDE